MTGRLRAAAAMGCAALALAACMLMLLTHSRAGAFSSSWSLTAGTVRRGARTPVRLPTGDVDVNTADTAALCALKGVGPVTAQAILEERAQNGPFDYPQDLLTVRGIGEGKLAKFYDQLDFSHP